jgi:predicted permease
MRYALRALLRTPSFTAIAVLTLAVGIGTNTTIFAIVDELAFKPARSQSSADVFVLPEVQIPDYDILTAAKPSGIEAIAAFDGPLSGTLQIPGRAERVSVWRVTSGYAAVQHVRAQVGRWIDENDNVGGDLDPPYGIRGVTRPLVRGRLGAPVVVISDQIWREWFGAAPDVAQRGTVTLNQAVMRIVGVAPATFETGIDIWTPFGQRRLLTRSELDEMRPRKRPVGWVGPLREPTQPSLQLLLRKTPGVPDDVVRDRLAATFASRPVTVDQPASATRPTPRRGASRPLPTAYTILGFAALVFVAACANLGNMLFARATEREGELAVRLSLGATRAGIFNLIFSETVLICTAASAAGLLMAAGVLRMFTDAFPAFQIGYWKRIPLDLSIDWRITGYAAGAGLVAAVIVGAGSLWRSGRVSLLARLAASGPAVVAKTEGRTVRTMLVAVQVTAAVLLLITTGMLLENTSKRFNRGLLFDTGALVSATVPLPPTYDESRGRHFFAELLERVRAIDGVSSAAATDALPGGEVAAPRADASVIVAEAPARGLSGVPRRLDGQWLHVSPGFVETLGMTVSRGRDFQPTDQAGSEPVALVSETTAARLWPGDDPIGKRLWCCREPGLRRVVGVVPDPLEARDKPLALTLAEAMQDSSQSGGPGVFVLLPAAQSDQRTMLIVLRSAAPRAAIQPLRDAIAALDPTVPVFDAGPVNATQFAGAASESAVRLLAGALGLISLGLSVFGVYAIVSYFVSRRQREFGLRLALGATRRQIVRLVVDYAIHIVLIGLLPGVLLASLGTRYFQAELLQLHPNGLTVWVAVPLLMLAAGIVAAYIPARRAARVDPYKTLKEL